MAKSRVFMPRERMQLTKCPYLCVGAPDFHLGAADCGEQLGHRGHRVTAVTRVRN